MYIDAKVRIFSPCTVILSQISAVILESTGYGLLLCYTCHLLNNTHEVAYLRLKQVWNKH